MRPFSLVGVAVFLTILGCQPASRYGPAADTPEPEKKNKATPESPSSLPSDLTWKLGRPPARYGHRLDFVHESNTTEWNGLKQFWTKGFLTDPTALVPFVLQPALTGPLIAAPNQEIVRVRVPLGLDDPKPYLPDFNPPTDVKWELGRLLFFDRNYLTAKHDIACADCHRPESGFTEAKREHNGLHTPSLVNVLYNRRQFWDGRATHLEEVVARSLDDEREPEEGAPFRHTWGGSVRRLQDSPKYTAEFMDLFGTPPTQDAIGKVLATYLRTLLAGNSLHDRALTIRDQRNNEERKRGQVPNKELTEADYAAALDHAGKPKAEAADLHRGYRLFHNLEKDRPLNCVNCHGGAQFTDGRFHNVGIGWKDDAPRADSPGSVGHFPHAPVGAKDRHLVGAYKTPTLRGLSYRAPYFHDGRADTLTEALNLHTQDFLVNPYLADAMRQPLILKPEEKQALLAFLKALEGEPVDKSVTAPPPPEP